MKKRVLEKTDLEVTRLGYGAMEIRGPRVWNGRQVTDKQAETILNAVLDAGINFIDTSYDYGRSEEYIGKFVSQRRNEYYLSTKCGCTLVDKGDHDDTPHLWTRKNLLHNIETSLKRMKTDYVDLWQLHNPTPEHVKGGDLLEVMEEVKASGKVRHISISSTLPHINTFINEGLFDTFQIPYSALQREHESVITAVTKAGAGTIIRGGVARGEPSQAGGLKGEFWGNWDKANLDELRAPGESKTAFLLRFTLSHPDIHTIIVGTLNPEHLAENLKTVESGPLSEDIYRQAKRRLDAAGIQPAK